MTNTEFPTARVIWKARAIGQDINDPSGIPEEIPLGGIKVDLIPNPKVIECTNGAGDPVTYRIKEWHLVTANNGELINYEDLTNGIEIVASDAFPGYVVSWKSIIEDPSETLPPIIKKWLAPAGSIVDLTMVANVPSDPNPIEKYLQAVYDAREAADQAQESADLAQEHAESIQVGEIAEEVAVLLKDQFGKYDSINNVTGTAYSIVSSDSGLLLTFGSATETTITLPNDSVNIDIGSHIDIVRIGTGSVTLSPGVGVSINATGLSLRSQYSAASLVKVASNTWLVVGDIA